MTDKVCFAAALVPIASVLVVYTVYVARWLRIGRRPFTTATAIDDAMIIALVAAAFLHAVIVPSNVVMAVFGKVPGSVAARCFVVAVSGWILFLLASLVGMALPTK